MVPGQSQCDDFDSSTCSKEFQTKVGVMRRGECRSTPGRRARGGGRAKGEGRVVQGRVGR